MKKYKIETFKHIFFVFSSYFLLSPESHTVVQKFKKFIDCTTNSITVLYCTDSIRNNATVLNRLKQWYCIEQTPPQTLLLYST